MAYNTPPTKAAGDTFTAAEFNTYIRDNMAAMAPDLFAAKGDLLAASAANVGQALAVSGYDYSVIEVLSTETVGIRWTQAAPGALMGRASAMSIANNTSTLITGFGAASYDKGGFQSGDTFVTPNIGIGVYLIYAYGYWEAHATDDTLRQIGIDVDGGIRWASVSNDVDGSVIYQQCTHIIYTGASHVVQMRALQKSGGALNITDASLSIMRLR